MHKKRSSLIRLGIQKRSVIDEIADKAAWIRRLEKLRTIVIAYECIRLTLERRLTVVLEVAGKEGWLTSCDINRQLWY